ncbi:MAG: hypothetical protein M0R03_05055 [Novosphingobium sp.]|nr:hypothetical protein [Novosphingobium sp.]
MLTAAASPANGRQVAKPPKGKAGAAQHKFEMNIEETRITLVGNQAFQTFAYARCSGRQRLA